MSSTINTFKDNIKSVDKLINFDKEVLGFAILQIEEQTTLLTNPPYSITNEQENGNRTIQILKDIRNNSSLKPRYSTINNQAIVLLVSYFGSAITDLFRRASKIAVEKYDRRVLNSELKIKVEELLNFGSTLGESIGDILITKNSISFQDMKSIQGEFNKYFGIHINKNSHVNNIILGQACRHAIAHEAGIINSRVINQVKSAFPRDIKLKLIKNETLTFTEKEITTISKSMLIYVSGLENMVNDYQWTGSHEKY